MTREIFQENNYQPGPGFYQNQYSHKYSYFYKESFNSQFNDKKQSYYFANKDQRLKSNDNKIPGPGNYFKQKSESQKIQRLQLKKSPLKDIFIHDNVTHTKKFKNIVIVEDQNQINFIKPKQISFKIKPLKKEQNNKNQEIQDFQNINLNLTQSQSTKSLIDYSKVYKLKKYEITKDQQTDQTELGQYYDSDRESCFKKDKKKIKAKKFENNLDRFPEIKSSNPEYYTINNNKNIPGFSIERSERFNYKQKDINLDPGHYDPKNSIQDELEKFKQNYKNQIFVSKSQRFLENYENQIPGPGAYIKDKKKKFIKKFIQIQEQNPIILSKDANFQNFESKKSEQQDLNISHKQSYPFQKLLNKDNTALNSNDETKISIQKNQILSRKDSGKNSVNYSKRFNYRNKSVTSDEIGPGSYEV